MYTLSLYMADQEMIQEKIGEALGLEMAAQKALGELDSRSLLESEHMKKLAKMREEASDQEEEMQQLVKELAESDGLDPSTIEEKAARNSRESVKNNGNVPWRRSRCTRGLRVSLFGRRRRSNAL